MKIVSIEEQIKMSLIHSNMTQKELADKIKISPQSLKNRLKTGKFTKEELQTIATAMGATYYSYFKFPDGNEY